MRVMVCVKQVLNLDMVVQTDWQVDCSNQLKPLDYVNRVMNLYDENALEVALKLKDSMERVGKALELVVLTIGGDSSRKMMEKSYALGADRCIRVEKSNEKQDNPALTAKIIQTVLKKIGEINILFAGVMAGEFDNGQTGLLVTELLHWPCLTEVQAVASANGKIHVTHIMDEGSVISEIKTPVTLLTGNIQEINLRMPTMRKMLEAAEKKEEVFSLYDLGMEAQSNAGKEITTLSIPKKSDRCTMFTGTAEEQVEMIYQVIVKSGVLR